MDFEAKYPRLYTLFAGYIHAYDYIYPYPLDEQDEHVLASYRADCSADELQQTVRELDGLLVDTTSWEEAMRQANRYCPTVEKKMDWFALVRQNLLE
jgi:hypothetical protein